MKHSKTKKKTTTKTLNTNLLVLIPPVFVLLFVIGIGIYYFTKISENPVTTATSETFMQNIVNSETISIEDMALLDAEYLKNSDPEGVLIDESLVDQEFVLPETGGVTKVSASVKLAFVRKSNAKYKCSDITSAWIGINLIYSGNTAYNSTSRNMYSFPNAQALTHFMTKPANRQWKPGVFSGMYVKNVGMVNLHYYYANWQKDSTATYNFGTLNAICK